MAPDPSSAPDPMVPAERARLRRLNAIAAVLHVVQAVVVVALANDFDMPVDARYLADAPGRGRFVVVHLGHLRTAWVVAAFFALSALAHALVAGPVERRYAGWIERRINPARWVEYSMSSSLMIVVIAQLCGVADVAALISMVGVNVSMILFGWLQERDEQPGGSLVPFWFGCIAGITPWLAILVHVIGPGAPASASPPAFVYAIVVSLFVFFNCFAVNQWLQYRKVGRWSSYRYGEVAYVLLSLTAKSLLAWQVFGGTLAG